MNKYKKAVVAVVGAVVTVLAVAGIDVEPAVVTAVTTLLTSLLVYFVPNDA